MKKHRTIILPVVLYGCETWSLTSSEERRLRVFGNRVLRKIFEPKRDEVTREWRKLCNEQLNDLYCSPNIVRVKKIENEMGWACSLYGDWRDVYQYFMWKTKGKRPLGRTRRRWEDDI
jgi:hypothetical protein